MSKEGAPNPALCRHTATTQTLHHSGLAFCITQWEARQAGPKGSPILFLHPTTGIQRRIASGILATGPWGLQLLGKEGLGGGGEESLWTAHSISSLSLSPDERALLAT